MNRAVEVALLARRLRLLVGGRLRRVEHPERAELAVRNTKLDPLEKLLVAEASEDEVDCAKGLTVLWPPPHPSAQPRAWIIGWARVRDQMAPTMKAAVWLVAPDVLPADQHEPVLNNPEWRTMDDQVLEEAAAVGEDLAWNESDAFNELTPEERADLEQFRAGHICRYLGLQHGLTPEQLSISRAAEEALAETWGVTRPQ